jgi:hypothetical protein
MKLPWRWPCRSGHIRQLRQEIFVGSDAIFDLLKEIPLGEAEQAAVREAIWVRDLIL